LLKKGSKDKVGFPGDKPFSLESQSQLKDSIPLHELRIPSPLVRKHETMENKSLVSISSSLNLILGSDDNGGKHYQYKLRPSKRRRPGRR
jgi:hypothetical protein